MGLKARTQHSVADPADANRRDPAKPAAYYMAAIDLYIRRIRDGEQRKVAGLFGIISEEYIRCAQALYCLGAPRVECLVPLQAAAEYRRRLYIEGAGLTFNGLERPEIYLDVFAAAHFTGSASDLVTAINSRIPQQALQPWQQGFWRLLCGVFTGTAERMTREELDDLNHKGRYYAPLIELLQSRDRAEFHQRLDKYLVGTWGPVADRAARGDLKSNRGEYTGKWSLFSAAACDLVGEMPRVSRKAMDYIPVDLIASTRS